MFFLGIRNLITHVGRRHQHLKRIHTYSPGHGFITYSKRTRYKLKLNVQYARKYNGTQRDSEKNTHGNGTDTCHDQQCREGSRGQLLNFNFVNEKLQVEKNL